MLTFLRSFGRVIGVLLLNSFATIIGAISSLLFIILSLLFIFSAEHRSYSLFFIILSTASICLLSLKVLIGIEKKKHLLINNINQAKNLNLNTKFILGDPAEFFVFDKQNRMIAICNSVTGSYELRDFSYILKWRYEWTIDTRMEIGIGGSAIPGTNMRAPSTTERTFKKDFELVLEVADENNPLRKFPMPREIIAEQWCARLNAMING